MQIRNAINSNIPIRERETLKRQPVRVVRFSLLHYETYRRWTFDTSIANIYLRKTLLAATDPLCRAVTRVPQEDRNRCRNCRLQRNCKNLVPRDPPATSSRRFRAVVAQLDCQKCPVKANVEVEESRLSRSGEIWLFARQLEISSTYFQYGNATADDNIVTDMFHYASRFAGDESQQDRRLV